MTTSSTGNRSICSKRSSTTSTSTTKQSTSTLTTSTISSTIYSTTSSALSLTTVTAQINFNININVNNIAQLQTLMNYLSDPSIDVSACISNCSSGNGYCANQLINNYKLYCICKQGYYGYACENTLSDYTTMNCLNGGTLVNNIINNTLTSSCLCPNDTLGASCESKIDPCQNETCSDHGNCYVEQNTNLVKCKCIILFYGDKCELQSSELKTIKTVISVTTKVAIGAICAFFSIFMLMDVSSILIKRKRKLINLKKKRNRVRFY